MREAEFQRKLITEIKDRFQDCVVIKNDADYIQGIPDITVFWENHWATLECKRSAKASHRPNQDYYVDKMNRMSFSAFVYPENMEDVLDDMERSFKGCTRR